jgi:hypothetical protein
MSRARSAKRLDGLPLVAVAGHVVPLATGFQARLLGLAGLDVEEAGPGLLIPRCASVHTFGMRFALDLHFVGPDGAVLAIRREVGPRRVCALRGAAAVLELPALADQLDLL